MNEKEKKHHDLIVYKINLFIIKYPQSKTANNIYSTYLIVPPVFLIIKDTKTKQIKVQIVK